MAKWPILILMVLFANITSADKGEIETYKPDEVFDLSIHLTNSPGEVLGATCKTQIRDDNLTVVDNLNMGEINGGWYNLTYSRTKTGKYLCRQNCTKGDFYVADTCDFIIKEGIDVITAIIFIFGIGLVFLILGITQQDWNFGMLSGFVFSILGIYIFISGLPTFDNFVSNSLALILVGAGVYIIFRATIDALNEAEGK